MNTLRLLVAVGVTIALAGCDSRLQTSVPDTMTRGATSAAVQRAARALEGNWTTVSFTTAGKSVEVTGGTVAFAGGKVVMTAPSGETTTYLYRINPSAEPKTIELTHAQDTNAPPKFAIYELDGKSLRLCLGGEGAPPTAFGADGRRVILLRRK